VDYNIKFEYKGLGKGIQGARQKAIQQSKKATESGISPVSASSGKNKDISSATYTKLNSSIAKLSTSIEKVPRSINQKEKKSYTPSKEWKRSFRESAKDAGLGSAENKAPISKLNSSIIKLISSNEKLAKSIEKGKSSGGGGEGGGTSGFGSIGTSIPILGALIAASGLAIQKINQIGNAYIEKASEQLPNVGISGFRTKGAGIYTASQISGGMGAYARSTGKFTTAAESPSAMALKVGAIHGLSAEETLRTAGQFKRAGANYGQAAAIGTGAGIEAQLPILLTGMADSLTEAVKEGINTSDMAKDMAQEIAGLAMTTPGKSVEAALNMINNFKGVIQGITKGKVQTSEQLYATGAAQSMLMRRISGENLQDLGFYGQMALKGGAISKDQAARMSKENYVSNLEKQEFISKEQADKLRKLGPTTDFSKLQQTIPGLAMPLLRKFTAETNPVEVQKETYKLASKNFENTPESRQRFYDFTLSQNWSQSQSQTESILKNNTKEPDKNLEKKGMDLIAERSGAVEGGPAGMAAKQIQQREELMFQAGKAFADTTMKMERGMLKIAKEAAPAVDEGLRKLGIAADTVEKGFKKVAETLDTFSKNQTYTNKAGTYIANPFGGGSIFVPAGNQ
jgi:hypothetical protein